VHKRKLLYAAESEDGGLVPEIFQCEFLYDDHQKEIHNGFLIVSRTGCIPATHLLLNVYVVGPESQRDLYRYRFSFQTLEGPLIWEASLPSIHKLREDRTHGSELHLALAAIQDTMTLSFTDGSPVHHEVRILRRQLGTAS